MTAANTWRIARASVTGRFHRMEGAPCQDAHAAAVEQIGSVGTLIAAASDGAGSYPTSQIGSELACRTFIERARIVLGTLPPEGPPDDEIFRAVMEDVRGRLELAAIEQSLALDDLSCTFVGAVAAPTWSACLQVGDGVVVTRAYAPDSQPFELALRPERGEYANETFFLTSDDWREHLQVRVDAAPLGAVVLATDGMQHLILQGDAPVQAWFARIVEPLAQISEESATNLSRELERYLASDRVAARTQDDLTLVIGFRSPCLDRLAGAGVVGVH